MREVVDAWERGATGAGDVTDEKQDTHKRRMEKGARERRLPQ